MKKLLLASTALGGLVLAGPALAADLPVRSAPPVAAPVFTWTGCYIGGNLAAGIAKKDWNNFGGSFADLASGFSLTETFSSVVSTSPTTSTTLVASAVTTAPITSANHDSLGFLGGGQVGCDLQFAPNWVIGFEAAGDGSEISVTDSTVFTTVPVTGVPGTVVVPGMVANFQSKIRWLASATARLGYVTSENWLFYVKGGAAWVGDRYQLFGTTCTAFTVSLTGTATCDTSNPFNFQASQTRLGWTTGLGLEYAFGKGFSAKIEWDFYDFGNKRVTFSDILGTGGGIGSTDIHQWVNVFLVGVNYRFGMGKATPVVARY